jgi:hypothetical protein
MSWIAFRKKLLTSGYPSVTWRTTAVVSVLNSNSQISRGNCWQQTDKCKSRCLLFSVEEFGVLHSVEYLKHHKKSVPSSLTGSPAFGQGRDAGILMPRAYVAANFYLQI